MPASCSASRTVWWNFSDSGDSGRRRPCSIRPISASAHLTGIGFASTNRRWCSGSRLQVELARLLHVADQRRGAHLVHQLGRDVGGDRDHAVAAEQDQRERGRILAAVDREVARRALDEVGAALDVRGRVLDADDAGHLRQAQHRVVLHVRHRARRHVVQDHRQVDRLRDLAEMAVQAFLRRLVVVGHHRQAGGGAGLLRRLGQLDRLGGGVAAGAGDDRDAAAANAATAMRISSLCSSKSTVGDSPVVPTTTMPSVPSATCQSISFLKAPRSSGRPRASA